jgi:uncharacterized protein (TIGR02145 family)
MKSLKNFILIIFFISSILAFTFCKKESDEKKYSPLCKITYPNNGETFSKYDTIAIKINSEDKDGIITKVVIYANDERIASIQNFPFQYEWNTLWTAPGDYTIKVKAYDNQGKTTTDQVNIQLEGENSFIDERDGQEYKIVAIGKQIWMAENLNYDAGEGSWIYNEEPGLEKTYGRLYNWETACKVCPEGWHLPSKSEWEEMLNYYGGLERAIKKIIKPDTILWEHFYPGAINCSGFSAIPGGVYNYYSESFQNLGQRAVFYTSTDQGYYGVWQYEIFLDHNSVLDTTIYNSKMMKVHRGFGYSVRCIRDD